MISEHRGKTLVFTQFAQAVPVAQRGQSARGRAHVQLTDQARPGTVISRVSQASATGTAPRRKTFYPTSTFRYLPPTPPTLLSASAERAHDRLK